MTNHRQALLQVLTQIQNDQSNAHRDILTITGCGMTDQEVADHIGHEFEQMVRAAKERAAKAARKAKRNLKLAA